MKTVVLYHGPSCADGFGAAFSAWRALGDDAEYIPVNYGQPPPAGAFECNRLFILDFSYPRAVLEKLASVVGEILILDHHKTAQADLEGLPYARFDMEKSGAVLAWEHFHPGRPVPMLLQYVQDRDMWLWHMLHSREVNAALAVESRDFGAWDWIARHVEFSDYFEKMVDRGRAILGAQSRHVASLCDDAFLADVGGHRVPVVNSPVFQSEIGEELCKRHPDAPFAAAFVVGPDRERWSLRSRNGFDVSAVAGAMGGGGHTAAAGFERPRPGGRA